MQPVKFTILSVIALAIPAGTAILPTTAQAQTATNSSSSITDYGTSGSAAAGTLLTDLANLDASAVPSSAAPTATPAAIAASSSSGTSLADAAVFAQAGPTGNPDITPEPAIGSIALIVGLGALMHRRRKPQA